MLKHRLLAVTFISVFAITGCASSSIQVGAHSTALETQLVETLIAAAEREGRASKVLLAPNLPPGIKSAAAKIRPSQEARSDGIAGLAKGQILLQSASLQASDATLTARLGPVPKPRHNVTHHACGTGLTVTFNLVGGQWQQGDLQILEC